MFAFLVVSITLLGFSSLDGQSSGGAAGAPRAPYISICQATYIQRQAVELRDGHKSMVPDKHNALELRDGHKTMVLPVVFPERLEGRHDASGNFQSISLLFVQAVQILGDEWHPGGRRPGTQRLHQ